MANRTLFVCTSNFDRSPALEKYFSDNYPQHEFRSAGINKYFCGHKGTHLIDMDDLRWANIIVWCEDIHFRIVSERFDLWRENTGNNRGTLFYTDHDSRFYKDEKYYFQEVTLNLGTYEQGCIGEDYLTRAEEKLKHILK